MRWDIILPAIITFIYAASFIRLDLKQSFRDAFRLHSLVISISLSALILCVVPLGYTGLARLFGLDQIFMPSLVWFAVAPPIASTIWMCAMLGFRATLAMEIVVITSLAAPFTGPFIASLVLQDIAVIEPLPLFFRLAMMIFGGGVIAYFGQKMLGRDTINCPLRCRIRKKIFLNIPSSNYHPVSKFLNNYSSIDFRIIFNILI